MTDLWLYDSRVIDVVSSATFWLALGPIAWLVLARREVGVVFWIFAVGFLSSLLGDAIGTMDKVAGMSEGRWLNTYLWPPVMFAILARAVIADPLRWWLAVAVIGLVAWLDLRAGIDGAAWLATAVGAVIVCFALWRAPDPSPLHNALVVLCGVGSILYCAYAITWESYYVSTAWWYAYQGSRLAAFGLFGRAVWR